MNAQPWRLVFSAFIVLLVTLLFSFPFVSPGTDSYYAAVFALVPITIGLAGSGVLILIEWEPF